MDASLSGSSNPLASKGSCEDTAGAKECGNRRRAALVLLKRLLVPRELLRLSEAECYYLRGGGKGGGGSQEISAGAAEGEAPPSQVTASQSSGKASPKATRRSCCAASVPGAPFQAGLPALPFSHPLQFVAVPLDCPRAARRVCQCSSEAEAWLRGAGFAASCSGRLRSRRWRPEREALASSAHKASLSSTAASSSYKCEDCGKWRLGSFYPCYFPVDPQSIGDGSARDVGAFLSLVAGCGSVRARFGVDVKCVSASGEERVSCSEEDAPLWKGAVRVSPCFAYASNERLAPHFELQESSLRAQVLLECLVHPLGFAPLPRSVYFQHQHFRDARNPEALQSKPASRAASAALSAFLKRADALVPRGEAQGDSTRETDIEQRPPAPAGAGVGSSAEHAAWWSKLVSPARAVHFLEWRVTDPEVLVPCRVLLAVSSNKGAAAGAALEKPERLNVAHALQRDLNMYMIKLAPYFERLTDVHFKGKAKEEQGDAHAASSGAPSVALSAEPCVKVKTEPSDNGGDALPDESAGLQWGDLLETGPALQAKLEEDEDAKKETTGASPPVVSDEAHEGTAVEPRQQGLPSPAGVEPRQQGLPSPAGVEPLDSETNSGVSCEEASGAVKTASSAELVAPEDRASENAPPNTSFPSQGNSSPENPQQGGAAEPSSDEPFKDAAPADSAAPQKSFSRRGKLLADLSSDSEGEAFEAQLRRASLPSQQQETTAHHPANPVSGKAANEAFSLHDKALPPVKNEEGGDENERDSSAQSLEARRLQEEVRRLQEALKLEREARLSEEALKEQRQAEWLKRRNQELEREVERLRRAKNGEASQGGQSALPAEKKTAGHQAKTLVRSRCGEASAKRRRRSSRSPPVRRCRSLESSTSSRSSSESEGSSDTEASIDFEAKAQTRRIGGGAKSGGSREEVEFVTFMCCGTTPAETVRIEEKLGRLVKCVKPQPRDARRKGEPTVQTAGSGGPKVVGWPSSPQGWDEVCFLVVADDCQHERLSREAKFLAALVAEVFIVREAALDFILTHFERWPKTGSNEHVALDKALSKHEYRGGKLPKLEDRQELAEGRLFSGHEFYVCGSSREANFIKTLIVIGNGCLASRGDNCDYVIICDESLPEAKALHRKLSGRDEEVVASTHGLKHSSLVTPKFLYDCVLGWTLMRPCRRNGHVAFRKAAPAPGARGSRP